MPLSQSNEVKQVDYHLRPDNGTNRTVTLKQDADEDREIIGYEWSLRDHVVGNSFEVNAEAWIGSHPVEDMPGSGEGFTNDVGGRFHTHAHVAASTDSTNGLAYSIVDLPQNTVGGDENAWDWNEDVTLTVEAEESMGQATLITFSVYYREV